MSKALITIATEAILVASRPFLENQAAYARAQDFKYSIAPDTFWKDLHPSFSKVEELRKALVDGWDYVVWADADVAFLDRTWDILTCLKNKSFVAAYQQGNWQQWKYLCAGLTVWRNCPEARDFVKEWHYRVTYGTTTIHPGRRTRVTYHPWEQWYFDEMIRECAYNGVYAATAKEIGCFCPEVWHDGTIWQDGMPTIHMAGSGTTWERKAEILEMTYTPKIKC